MFRFLAQSARKRNKRRKVPLNRSRLESLLSRFDDISILVVGDFFLDRYLVVDPSLAERSVETGLEARQVVEVLAAPGAAGTVTANLRALGVRVAALGLVGDDGEGYELRQGLRALGVDDAHLVVTPGRHTPAYVKPIVRGADGPLELERLDIRTRAPTPPEAIDALVAALGQLARHADAVIVADQMPEAGCGAITETVRTALTQLSTELPNTWFLADSRERIGLFSGLSLKPNMYEAARAAFPDFQGQPDLELARRAGQLLHERAGRPVFVTLGGGGALVVGGAGATHVPTAPARGPIDITGAGDSVMAALAAGLCAGATPEEAALLGNMAAAITIRQLGTTGTASRQQLLAEWAAFAEKN